MRVVPSPLVVATELRGKTGATEAVAEVAAAQGAEEEIQGVWAPWWRPGSTRQPSRTSSGSTLELFRYDTRADTAYLGDETTLRLYRAV